MEFRRSSFDFGSSSGSGQSASEVLSFSRQVTQVAVGIIGYSASFDDDDHHLGRLTVELNAGVDGTDNTKVNVSGGFALRDWSGEFDDDYSGNIQWVVLAELVPLPPPVVGGSRGDLIIIDAEITQAIQHFRSSRHLDASNVFPNNSIRFVANKPTVVRLYIDYDRNSGLPNISRLSGEIEVSAGSTSQLITPLSPIDNPIRDINIDRGIRGHTLNFLIPESLCNGVVNLKAKVFNASDSTQFSADFERSVSFEEMPALPIIAVGVEYTGENVNDGATPAELAAPVMNDFVNVFEFTEKIYPIPNVNITSFTTAQYDRDMESDISSGGCDKFGDLLDFLDDFKGNSDDLVFGMINSGVKTGSVGGCGRNGVAAGIIGSQGTAAHELGHALGRDHAPCDNVTRCAEPSNTDENYPNYSGYNSDSIGEYGFDTTRNRVLSPSNAHDFMGYSGNAWISPYTYKALMSRIPSTFGASGAGLRASRISVEPARNEMNEWIPIKTPQLFLRIDIDYERKVNFHTAFYFNSRPRAHGNVKTNFSVAFLDKNGKVIRSSCLYTDNACSCCCGDAAPASPIKIRQAVSFPRNSKTLIISECDKEIYREDIPEEPKVNVNCKGNDDPQSENITLEWNVSSNDREKGFMFLVQWRDRRGTWRGCAPRTAKNNLEIPKRLFNKQRNVALRVLASSGIATGVGFWEGDFDYAPTDKPNNVRVEIQLVGVPSTGGNRIKIPSLIKAAAIINGNKTDAFPEIVWYNDKGVEIGRGRSFNLNKLPYGETLVKASVLDKGQGSGNNQWLIERNRNEEFYILRGTIERKKPC